MKLETCSGINFDSITNVGKCEPESHVVQASRLLSFWQEGRLHCAVT